MKPGNTKGDSRPLPWLERIIAAVLFVVYLVAVASNYAGWRLFGGYGGWVRFLLFVAFVIYLTLRLKTKRT